MPEHTERDTLSHTHTLVTQAHRHAVYMYVCMYDGATYLCALYVMYLSRFGFWCDSEMPRQVVSPETFGCERNQIYTLCIYFAQCMYYVYIHVCMFITGGPGTKLCAGERGEVRDMC